MDTTLTLTKADICAALAVQPKPQGAGLRDSVHFYASGQMMVTDGSLMLLRKLPEPPAVDFSVALCDLASFKAEKEVYLTVAHEARTVEIQGYTGVRRTSRLDECKVPNFQRIISRDSADKWYRVSGKYAAAIDKIARLYGSTVVLRPTAAGNVNIFFSRPDLFGVVSPLREPSGKYAVPVTVPDWIPMRPEK